MELKIIGIIGFAIVIISAFCSDFLRWKGKRTTKAQIAELIGLILIAIYAFSK